LIQKVLGELSPEQNEMFSKNPRFLGLKFPDVSKPETLEKRYVGKMSRKALSLMNGLLRMSPKDRISGLKALTHPYFDEIRFKDAEFYKIIDKKELEFLQNKEVTRPIQSSQGPVDNFGGTAFEERHRNMNSRAGTTAYSGFDNSIKDIPMKRKSKKHNKSK
jgi:serine/threonine protein kinase